MKFLVSTNPQKITPTKSRFLPIHKKWHQRNLDFYQSTKNDTDEISISANPQKMTPTKFRFLPIHKKWHQRNFDFCQFTKNDTNEISISANPQKLLDEMTVWWDNV
jgi:carbohydrate-binding DOMON domain-containing protein